MKPSTTHMNGSKPKVYDSSCQFVYSKYTIYVGTYNRFYSTYQSFSQKTVVLQLSSAPFVDNVKFKKIDLIF